jgi:lipopolysaccharide/colanic/teichoic acid biosynthesis glycosyltransferase
MSHPNTPLSKRLLDIVASAAGLILLSPVLAAAAAIVKLSSPGPFLYRAARAGYRGRPFHALKIRTMHVGSDQHGSITANRDPRVFPTGRVLRLLKIDELPQLINVLRGEMSLVGPRPEDLQIVEEHYSEEQMRVLDVAPGLTGFPQVRFFPEYPLPARAGLDADSYYCEVVLPARLELDLDYVRRRSMYLDCRLILTTLYLILFKSWIIMLFGQRTPTVARSS